MIKILIFSNVIKCVLDHPQKLYGLTDNSLIPASYDKQQMGTRSRSGAHFILLYRVMHKVGTIYRLLTTYLRIQGQFVADLFVLAA